MDDDELQYLVETLVAYGMPFDQALAQAQQMLAFGVLSPYPWEARPPGTPVPEIDDILQSMGRPIGPIPQQEPGPDVPIQNSYEMPPNLPVPPSGMSLTQPSFGADPALGDPSQGQLAMPPEWPNYSSLRDASSWMSDISTIGLDPDIGGPKWNHPAFDPDLAPKAFAHPGAGGDDGMDAVMEYLVTQAINQGALSHRGLGQNPAAPQRNDFDRGQDYGQARSTFARDMPARDTNRQAPPKPAIRNGNATRLTATARQSTPRPTQTYTPPSVGRAPVYTPPAQPRQTTPRPVATTTKRGTAAKSMAGVGRR
jgi:hypothetical protein